MHSGSGSPASSHQGHDVFGGKFRGEYTYRCKPSCVTEITQNAVTKFVLSTNSEASAGHPRALDGVRAPLNCASEYAVAAGLQAPG